MRLLVMAPAIAAGGGLCVGREDGGEVGREEVVLVLVLVGVGWDAD